MKKRHLTLSTALSALMISTSAPSYGEVVFKDIGEVEAFVQALPLLARNSENGGELRYGSVESEGDRLVIKDVGFTLEGEETELFTIDMVEIDYKDGVFETVEMENFAAVKRDEAGSFEAQIQSYKIEELSFPAKAAEELTYGDILWKSAELTDLKGAFELKGAEGFLISFDAPKTEIGAKSENMIESMNWDTQSGTININTPEFIEMGLQEMSFTLDEGEMKNYHFPGDLFVSDILSLYLANQSGRMFAEESEYKGTFSAGEMNGEFYASANDVKPGPQGRMNSFVSEAGFLMNAPRDFIETIIRKSMEAQYSSAEEIAEITRWLDLFGHDEYNMNVIFDGTATQEGETVMQIGYDLMPLGKYTIDIDVSDFSWEDYFLATEEMTAAQIAFFDDPDSVDDFDETAMIGLWTEIGEKAKINHFRMQYEDGNLADVVLDNMEGVNREQIAVMSPLMAMQALPQSPEAAQAFGEALKNFILGGEKIDIEMKPETPISPMAIGQLMMAGQPLDPLGLSFIGE